MPKHTKIDQPLINDIPVYCACSTLADIESITPNPRNPNHHSDAQVELLSKIIKAHGWRAPITVSNRSGFVVRGHCRLLAARRLNLDKVPIDFQDYKNEAEEQADLIADNRLSELSDPDPVELKDLIHGLEEQGYDIELTGYNLDDLAELVPEEAKEAKEDDFDTTKDQVPAIVKKGEIWSLGRHRLMCGSSTSVADVAKLLDGRRANLTLTDPPYGVGEGYASFNDTEDELKKLVDGFFPIAQKNSDVILLTPGNKNQFLYPKPTWMLCWFVAAGTGRGPWGFTCWQPILAYGSDPYLKHGMGSRPDALSLTESADNTLDHPCPKPIKVWSWILERGSVSKDDLIFDPFSGSGTSFVACEQLDRTCYGMELDPHYCDVIIARWEKLTGKKAVKA